MSNLNITTEEFNALTVKQQNAKVKAGYKVVDAPFDLDDAPFEEEIVDDTSVLGPKPVGAEYSNKYEYLADIVDWLVDPAQVKVLVNSTYTLGKSTFELNPVRLNTKFTLVNTYTDKTTGEEKFAYRHDAIKMCLLILTHGVDAVNAKAQVKAVFANDYADSMSIEDYESEF